MKTPGAAALVLALGFQALPAWAQQTADAGDQTLERIEVTGSAIRRTDVETPSPVQVITADDLKKSGYTTVSDVLRNVSANNQGTLSQGFSGAFAAGATGVALRGLTVGATLVLIDGHRSAPYPLSDDGQRSFVDISEIPFDAIDRIEILKDGASAIYGSDAIAGVVNVILKKSFTGTRINAEHGWSSRDDGKTDHVSITSGLGDLAKDGQTGFISAEFRHQDSIRLIDRPGQITLRDYTPYGGINATPGVSNAANGGFPSSPAGSGYTVSPSTGLITSQVGCQSTNALGPNCPWFNNALEVQPATQNINLLGKYIKSLGADWQLGLNASMFQSRAEQVNGVAGTGGFGGNFGIKAGPNVPIPTVYPASGPYVVTVPSTGDILFTNFTGVGAQHTGVTSETYRLIADLSGSQWGWNLDTTLGYNRANTNQTVNGSISIPGLTNLLAANPTLNAAQTVALLQNPANNGVLAPTQYSYSTSEVDYLTVHGDRELFQFNGSPVVLALGAEYTHHALNATAPTGIANGTSGGNDAFAVGQQNIASAFFEVDANPIKSLEINFATRYDHVDTYGSSTTPKFGAIWKPIEQFNLRGTYSKGFRAPNPAEAGNAGQAFLYIATNDPVLCPGGGTSNSDFKAQCQLVPTFYQESNPKLQPEKSSSYTLGALLEPIRGDSVSFDYYSIKLDNQITSAINASPLSSLIGNAVRGPAGQIQQTVGGASLPIPVGLIEFIPVPYINANTVKTTGLDIDFRGRLDLKEAGVFTTALTLTRVFKYELTSPSVGTVELAGTHGPSGISGDTGTPQNRFVWTFNYDKGPFNATATVNYIGSFSVTDPASGLTNCTAAIDSNFNGSFTQSSTPTSNTCTVGSFTTLDLSARYHLNKMWQVYGSITNALDKAPPLDLETYGGSNYNPSMHQLGAIGRFYNVGLTVDF